MDVLSVLRTLVEKPSLTPSDEGCQSFLSGLLEDVGFEIIDCSRNGVTNTLAIKNFSEHGPALALSGHTDVVPATDTENWIVDGQAIDPFHLNEVSGRIFGRGVADMKGALAAFVCAMHRYASNADDPQGSLYLLLTSDEEGDRTDGTTAIVDYMSANNLPMDCALIGEATSDIQIGDTLFIGRRGSLHATVTVPGVVGHVARKNFYNPGLTAAAIHLMAEKETRWDDEFADEFFPATSCVVTANMTNSNVSNATASESKLVLNFRFNPGTTPSQIESKFRAQVADIHTNMSDHFGVNAPEPVIEFVLGSDAYSTSQDSKHLRKIVGAVEQTIGATPNISAGGGASDGCFLKPLGADVVELGLQGATIHSANESVPQDSVQQLENLTYEILKSFHGT